ncbi:hypothetical protein SEA_CASHLINE_75 [Gordonia phage Cashline]|nr:hypothetical protein SEA_CASHLINE_75 [Gordonia phage Cashline]
MTHHTCPAPPAGDPNQLVAEQGRAIHKAEPTAATRCAARDRYRGPTSPIVGAFRIETAMSVVEIVATRIIMLVVIPAGWIQARQMRRANHRTAAQKARDECGCGCCGVMDTLSGIDLDQ